jgi:hypothetical protein
MADPPGLVRPAGLLSHSTLGGAPGNGLGTGVRRLSRSRVNVRSDDCSPASRPKERGLARTAFGAVRSSAWIWLFSSTHSQRPGLIRRLSAATVSRRAAMDRNLDSGKGHNCTDAGGPGWDRTSDLPCEAEAKSEARCLCWSSWTNWTHLGGSEHTLRPAWRIWSG